MWGIWGSGRKDRELVGAKKIGISRECILADLVVVGIEN